MISRTLAAPTLLVATIGVPYVASNAPQWTQQFRGAATATDQSGWTPTTHPAAGAVPELPANPSTRLTAPPHGPSLAVYPNQSPLEGVPTYSLGEVLRFDVSKEWVYQRWPRKSTALAELDLYGVRVPLVTGTQLHDIAGSLTYVFGTDGRVRRISFRGQTGDTTQLATLVHQRFGLVAIPTAVAGEQLFQFRREGDVLSELRTRPAPVLWASLPHESFTVELELQDPATARPLMGPVVNLPAAATPPAAAQVQSGAKPQAAKEGAAGETAPAKVEPLGWRAFFPRSRVPGPQIRNLDQGNLYQ